jgi:hypothetical protein
MTLKLRLHHHWLGLALSPSTMTQTPPCLISSSSAISPPALTGERGRSERLVIWIAWPAPGAASWNKSGSIATINLDWGENAVCTYVNKKLPKVTIIKDAQPNDAQDFAFTTAGAVMSGFSLDTTRRRMYPKPKFSRILQPGAYSVTEGSVAGWTLTNLSCTGVGSWTPNGSTVPLVTFLGR